MEKTVAEKFEIIKRNCFILKLIDLLIQSYTVLHNPCILLTSIHQSCSLEVNINIYICRRKKTFSIRNANYKQTEVHVEGGEEETDGGETR